MMMMMNRTPKLSRSSWNQYRIPIRTMGEDVPPCQWKKAPPIIDRVAVGTTVDHGFVGVSVVVSSTTVELCVIGVTEELVAKEELLEATSSTATYVEAAALSKDDEAEAEAGAAVESEVSACQGQIQPVFSGSTEHTMSDVQLRMVFHESFQHPVSSSKSASSMFGDESRMLRRTL